MARRRTDSFSRRLHSLAHSAQWDELRALLRERLEQQPDDEEARSELNRLEHGLPLRVLESALERQRRLAKEMREELAAELALHRNNPALPAEWDAPLLRKRIRRISSIRTVLGSQLPDELRPAAEDYLTTLNHELRCRMRRQTRLRALLLLPVLLGLAAATALSFRQRAVQLDESLTDALAADDVLAVEHAANVADSGINRLVHPQLAEHIEQARSWLKRVRREQARVEPLIAALESGRGSVADLPQARRAEIENGLRRLPRNAQELRARWQRLCDRERDELKRQLEAVRLHYAAPLPPLPPPGGNLREDDRLLRQQQTRLEQKLRDFAEAQQAYALPDSLMEPTRKRLPELAQRLEDVGNMRRTAAALPAARSYSQYRSILAQNKPQRYEPALQMLEILDRLPTEEELRDQMQDKNRKLPPGMLEAARRALLEGGPTFTPTFHANALQVSLMEDLFTSRSLRTPLYELSSEGREYWLTESQPVLGPDGIRFTPSAFDSKLTTESPRLIVWENTQHAYIRRIDTVALMQRLNITRERFFRDTNLPALLDSLMQPCAPTCPALARAYIYKRLSMVMQAHEWPRMLGLPYAPTLRADLGSFAELERQLGFALEPGCWLLPSPERDAAEKAFARWFREREGRSYAGEIRSNFGKLVGLHPRFVGYIDENAAVRLCQPVEEGKLLWYISNGGVTTTPLGQELEAPALLSPLFIIEKD